MPTRTRRAGAQSCHAVTPKQSLLPGWAPACASSEKREPGPFVKLPYISLGLGESRFSFQPHNLSWTFLGFIPLTYPISSPALSPPGYGCHFCSYCPSAQSNCPSPLLPPRVIWGKGLIAPWGDWKAGQSSFGRERFSDGPARSGSAGFLPSPWLPPSELPGPAAAWTPASDQITQFETFLENYSKLTETWILDHVRLHNKRCKP